MLSLDSLAIDIIFRAGEMPDKDTLALFEPPEGEEPTWQILQPDQQFEMEISPSLPFRQQGEPRLVAVDVGSGPVTTEEQPERCVRDISAERDLAVAIAKDPAVRFVRLGLLSVLTDGVLIARSAQDLRAYALLMWVYSPQVDADGNQRSTPIAQADLQAKVDAYAKRLEELEENDILQRISGRLQRQDDLLIVDFMDAEGGYDFRAASEGILSIAALDTFSIIPGAPSSAGKNKGAAQAKPESSKSVDVPSKGSSAGDSKAPAKEEETVAPAAAIVERAVQVDGRHCLLLAADSLDPTVGASLGKRDYDALLRGTAITGQVKDEIHEHGAEFAAPIEFLSEVLYDGKPLDKPTFQSEAKDASDRKTMEVHYPRFGTVYLVELADGKRYVTSSEAATRQIEQLFA